ncbi:multicystatin-like [Canna indica]|uniref:Multicystatin-like n=1 Tax=Canna indica TaxID=4628 RepID=A0AAQ3Q486_9LILI|nr:multicystatin-like [Canna indica]
MRTTIFLSLLFCVVLFSHQAIAARDNLVGGWQPINGGTNDPHIQKLAQFAISENNKQPGVSFELVNVVKAEMQVVAGINYRLLLNAKSKSGSVDAFQAVVFESLKSELKLVSFVKINNDILVGGWQPINGGTSDPHIQKLAQFAVSENNKQQGASFELVNVVKAEMQVVAGINYRLLLNAKSKSGSVDTYLAVVFESLKSELKLVSFVEISN